MSAEIQQTSMVIIEVLGAGYDGSDDKTDDRVLWIAAETQSDVFEAIEGFGTQLVSEVTNAAHSDVDFTLPADLQALREKLAPWQAAEQARIAAIVKKPKRVRPPSVQREDTLILMELIRGIKGSRTAAYAMGGGVLSYPAMCGALEAHLCALAGRVLGAGAADAVHACLQHIPSATDIHAWHAAAGPKPKRD